MPSTISFQPGDLVLVDFPFTASGAGKPRPAMVVLDTGDADVIVARVTSQFATTPFDVSLKEWKKSGLLAPSIVRLHKLATLSESLIQQQLGTLDSVDRSTVSAVIRQLTAGW